MGSVFPVLTLARYILIFFLRRVLGASLLKSKFARFSVIGAALAVISLLSIIAYTFLKSLNLDEDLIDLLLDLSSISAVFWVIVVFTFTKVLFSKSDDLLELTFHLPVTNHQRALSLMIFETTIVLGVTLLIFASSIAPITLLYGFEAILKIFTAIVYPIFTVYLMLAIFYNFILYLLKFLRLARIQIMVFSVISLGFLYFYNVYSRSAVIEVSDGYLTNAESHILPATYSVLANSIGFLQTSVIFVFVIFLGLFLIAVTAPGTHIRSKKYIYFPIPVGCMRHTLSYYIAQNLRTQETVLAAMVSLVIYFALLHGHQAPPLVSLSTFSIIGLYAFEATKGLRSLDFTLHGRQIRQYILIIAAPIFTVTAFSLPLLLGILLVGMPLSDNLVSLGGAYGGILISTLIGIMFPPERDNPFSVFVGFTAFLAISLLVILCLGVLSLPTPVLILSLLLGFAIIVYYSIQGIMFNERNSFYHEEL